MMAIAIAIDTFFSTCGACATAGPATSTDAPASKLRQTRRIMNPPVLFLRTLGETTWTAF
jgi:hypothetical protein